MDYPLRSYQSAKRRSDATWPAAVDDRPENCLNVKLESRARPILIWNADPADIPPNARKLGIEPVSGIGACLDLLTAAPARKPTLLDRIKQFIG
jgi:hypothetical protein